MSVTRHRALLTCATVLLAGTALATACSSDGGSSSSSDESGSGSGPSSTVVVDDRFVEQSFIAADQPAALAVTPDGTLYVGELTSGRILAVAADQLTAPSPVTTEFAQLDVATDGQQGLLGLVVLADGTLLAGLTADDAGTPRQVVDRVVPGSTPVRVWTGPVAADQAVGGRLALMADGRVLIGLGDFLRGRAASFGPDEPYSKLLSLDPDGPADQTPIVVSSGWNNPFAFTVAPDGAVWIADNAPGKTPERIGRGDGQGAVTDMDTERAPSGLAVLGTEELVVCGVVSGLLELVPVVDGVAQQPTTVLADPCTLGVLALPGGDLAVAVADGVRILTPR